ncbi:hypothetical protein EHQ94_19780 [Leptospira meyeri]|uniref:hypothetical protein n=1 Tax=Leptospira meyeri TaxID=29508 RepID=UPI00108351B6|nr:hypothetical protein [Leptospira meyeri]TGM62933.1 hypothetical protein EHQ94_19780 [Leptospira meyeri]TGM68304.1 hypothetical protein EHQ93_00270 [Leptospira meyeri]
MKKLFIYLISLLIMQSILNCSGKPKKINKSKNCKAEIENYSNTANPNQFHLFVNTIKNKDCLELKKWLSEDFFYSLDELNVYVPFYKKNKFKNGVDICDFFFNQKTFENVIYRESNVHNVISPYELIQNAYEISISGTPNINVKPYGVTMEVRTCIDGIPYPGLPTEFSFDCESKPIAKCSFHGVYSWTNTNNN